MSFVATINVPGYLPMDDDPPVFDTAREAWAYLADERMRDEDGYAPGPYSSTHNTMEGIAEGTLNGADFGLDESDLTGTIYGPTPDEDYDGDHDLGLAYSVTETVE